MRQPKLAADDYRSALDLYENSGGYGTATLRISEMQASQDSANTRLERSSG
jgi:hypothetical protein